MANYLQAVLVSLGIRLFAVKGRTVNEISNLSSYKYNYVPFSTGSATSNRSKTTLSADNKIKYNYR